MIKNLKNFLPIPPNVKYTPVPYCHQLAVSSMHLDLACESMHIKSAPPQKSSYKNLKIRLRNRYIHTLSHGLDLRRIAKSCF